MSGILSFEICSWARACRCNKNFASFFVADTILGCCVSPVPASTRTGSNPLWKHILKWWKPWKFYCVLRDQGGCKQPNLCLNPISLHFFKRRPPILGTHHCVSSPKNVNACNVKTSQSLVSSAGSTPISVCQNHNLIHHWSFKSASILIMSPVLWVKKCNVSLGEIT
jgi:hypothetical protein